MVDQITVYWMLGVLGIMIAFGVFSLVGYRMAKNRGDGTADDIPDNDVLPEYRKTASENGAPAQK